MDRRLIYCHHCGENRLGRKTEADARHICAVCGSDNTGPYLTLYQWQELKAKKDAAMKRAQRAIRKFAGKLPNSHS